MASPFAFAVCQAGAEAALKRELSAEPIGWRSAFARPGLVTFKAQREGLDVDALPRSVFARRLGLSFGACADVDALAEHWARLPGASGPWCVHVFARPQANDEDGAAAAPRVALVREQIATRWPAQVRASARAEPGELVLDVIVGDRDEPLWIGAHRQRPDDSPWPGGGFPIALPALAPSRAYLKLAQALAWSRAPLRVGDCALEIGSAPGGATLALLERGIHVLGVDPGAMDAGVLAHVGPGGARVQHLAIAVGGLAREQLPDKVHWLVLDMNLAPQVALRSLQRLIPPLRKHLCGMFLTLKLNEWSMADEIPRFVAQTERFGLLTPRVIQLPANRQEVLLFGLTAVGARR